jgi:hypothetical protein
MPAIDECLFGRGRKHTLLAPQALGALLCKTLMVSLHLVCPYTQILYPVELREIPHIVRRRVDTVS